MVTANLKNRIMIDDLLNRYESLLLNNGLLEKYKIHFENNILVDGLPTDINIQTKIESIKSDDVSITEKEKQINVKTKLLLCSPQQEFHPYLKKCVTKCNKNMVRNEEFKCVKTQKNIKNKKSKTLKTLKMLNNN